MFHMHASRVVNCFALFALSLPIASTASAAPSHILWIAHHGYCGDERAVDPEACDTGRDASCGSDCLSRPGLNECTTDAECYRAQMCGIGSAEAFGTFDDVCWPQDCEELDYRRQACGSYEAVCGQCPPLTGYRCDDNLDCDLGLECRAGVSDRFGYAYPASVCWDSLACDDWSSELFACGSSGARCGSICPTCTRDCAGKSCGYDGCFGSCGTECGDGQAGCRTHDDCATGLECIPSASGPNVCRPAYCNDPRLNPCSYPAYAGQQTACGTCPICVPDCTGRECGPDPICGASCGPAGPNQFCSPEGTIEPASSDLTQFDSGDPEPPIAPPSTPGTLVGRFDVSDFGQATYTVPLSVPPGRSGIEPSLALKYSSAGGNGYLGMGWGLSGLSAIQRCPQTIAQDGEPAPITYTSADRFCLDGNRLVLENPGDIYGAHGTKYRTEVETFSRIVSEGAGGPEPISFKVYTRDGRIMSYAQRIDGNTPFTGTGLREPDYQEPDPSAVRTQTWALTKVEDRFGNAMHVEYIVAEGCGNYGAALCSLLGGTAREYYPSRIYYTSHPQVAADREVTFDYRPRRDVLTGYQRGVRFQRTQLLERITASVQGRAVFIYNFGYEEPGTDAAGAVPSANLHQRTLLTSVQQCGRASIEADARVSQSCMPPTRFEYEDRAERGLVSAGSSDIGLEWVADRDADFIGPALTLDMDGNGQDDVLYPLCVDFDPDHGVCIALNWGLSLNGNPLADSPIDDPQRMVVSGNLGLVPAAAFVMDYDRDGRDDVVEIDAQYRRGDESGHVRVWTFKPNSTAGTGEMLRVEPTGVSLGSPINPRLLSLEQSPGYSSVHLLDANGDSVSDLFVCTRDPGGARVWTWTLHLHDGTTGFGPAATVTTNGPRCTGGTPIDMDGDGRQELLLNGHQALAGTLSLFSAEARALEQASGVLFPITGQFEGTVIPAKHGSSIRLTLDANGDGLVDAVDFSDQRRAKVWINTGTGFISYAEHALDLSRGTTQLPYDGETFLRELGRFGTAFDENGDGRTDVLARVSPNRWAVLRSTGTQFVVESLPEGLNIGSGRHLTIYDANHDGLKDVREQHQLWHRAGAPSYRLTAATNGLGARVEVAYAALAQGPDEFDAELGVATYFGGLPALGCDYPCYARGPRGSVVRMVRRWDRVFDSQMQANRSFVYGYVNARSDLHGRGALGFGRRTIIDRVRHMQATGAGGLHERNVDYQNTTFDAQARIYPFVGRPQTIMDTTTTTAGRFRVQVVRRTFAIDHEPVARSVFPHVEIESHLIYEMDAYENIDVIKDLEIATDHDAYGNVERVTETWETGDENILTTTFFGDSAHVDRWLVSLPRTVTHSSTRAGLTPKTRTQRFCYAEDSDPECTGGPASLQFTGLPYAALTEPGNPARALTARYHYSETGAGSETGTGNLTSVETEGRTVDGLQTRTTSFDYDDRQMFPTMVTDANGHTVQLAYDPALGIPIGTREEGRPGEYVERFDLTDGFGRVRQVYDADGTVTDIAYLLRPDDAGGFSVATTRQGAPQQTTHYDVLGREELREFDGLDRRLEVVTRYDALGQISQISRVHSGEVSAPQFTTQTYDALGRPWRTTLLNGHVVERCYSGAVSCTRNPRGYTRCEVHNEHGELAHSVDPQDTYDECQTIADRVAVEFPAEAAPLATTAFRASRYQYGPFGFLLSIEDPAHHARIFEHDAYGRMEFLQDPNSGTWLYGYNAFGELEMQTDVLGQRSIFRYDPLGRRQSRTDLDPGQPDTGSGALTVWAWDYLFGAGFYGQLLSTGTSDGVATTYTYDAHGRLAQFSRSIPDPDGDHVLSRHHHYDDVGRLHRLTYDSPGGAPLELHYGYRNGHLHQVSRPPLVSGEPDEVPYWTALATDVYGQLESESLGMFGPYATRTYEPGTGNLQRLTTAALSGTTYQDWSYTYYGDGSIHTRTDHLQSGETTEYTYDAQDRLSFAVSPSFVEAYSYDEIGNITGRAVNEAGMSVWRSYNYDDGTGRPHAVKSVSQDGATQVYRYDANGQMNYRAGALQSGFVAAYNRHHMPISLSNSAMTVTLGYDADSVRVRKTTERPEYATQETFYLDDFYSRARVAGTSGFTERLVVSNGSYSVAELVRDPSGANSIRTTFTDHLGSVELVSGDGQSERRVYEAFGKRRSVTGSVTGGTRSDYTGHELDDEFGLVNMKARLYDPEIGRFLVPDPILAEPGWSQGLNPYSYVNNSPLNFIDPLGLQAAEVPPPVCDPTTPGGCPGGGDGGGGDGSGIGAVVAFIVVFIATQWDDGGPPPPLRQDAPTFNASTDSVGPASPSPYAWVMHELGLMDDYWNDAQITARIDALRIALTSPGEYKLDAPLLEHELFRLEHFRRNGWHFEDFGVGAGMGAASRAGLQAAGKAASTPMGRAIQSLRETLSTGKGPWKRNTAHAEGSVSKVYGPKATSIEEVFVNQQSGERIIRHTVVEGDKVLHETFRLFSKFE